MQFSVITVVKNDKKNILKTIKSLRKQTYKNFEHIVFDGSSSDGTLEIIKKNTYKKMKFFSEKDNGIYQAINKSIKLAKGKFIFLLHSGDQIISKHFLKKINDLLDTNDYDLISGNILFYRYKNNKINITRSWRKPITKRNKFTFLKIPHTSLFIKKNLINKIGLYKLKYKISSDIEFLIRLNFSNENLKYYYYDYFFILMKSGGLSTSINNYKQKLFEDLDILRHYFGYQFIFIYIYKVLSKIPDYLFKNNNN